MLAGDLLEWIRGLPWPQIRVWSAVALSFIAAAYTAATYRRNRQRDRRDQARFVYATLNVVGQPTAGATGDVSRLNFTDRELVDPENATDMLTVQWPCLLFELRLENKSRELITHVEMSVVTDQSADPVLKMGRQHLFDVRLVEPEGVVTRFALLPNYWALGLLATSHEVMIRFDDSSGNRWLRNGLRPPTQLRTRFRQTWPARPVLVGDDGGTFGPVALKWKTGRTRRRHPDYLLKEAIIDGEKYEVKDTAERWLELCADQGLDPASPPWWLQLKLAHALRRPLRSRAGIRHVMRILPVLRTYALDPDTYVAKRRPVS